MIRIGITGYGNLGQGLVKAIDRNDDMELAVVLTRRDPKLIQAGLPAPAAPLSEAHLWQDKVDVMVLCGGSATDLPEQGPLMASLFNTVDSYDNHSQIPAYFASVDKSASSSGHLSLIACGWDPGLFSMMRALFLSILPAGTDYTFWGKGVSQGHSDAIRRIPGVADARQYTIPVLSALEAAREGKAADLTTRDKHKRECYVVAEPGADLEQIKNQIVNMPAYFADYDTTVTFISQQELAAKHSHLPHGGFVIRSGQTSPAIQQTAEFSLKLESNPEFTSSVLAAFARAVYRQSRRGRTGAVTVYDLALTDISPVSAQEMRRKLL